MKTTVQKKKIDVYKVRIENSSVWGDITVEFGETSALVMINSDYGNYAYNWFSTGPNPKEFLCEISLEYAMEKLSNYSLYEPDTDKYENEIKNKILDSRKDDYLSKDEAREAWNDMLGILDDFNGGDIMYHMLVENKHFDKVFGDYESLPSAKRIKPKHVHFWNKIWIPFTEKLNEEIEEETVHQL